jgi:hypothetical protein
MHSQSRFVIRSHNDDRPNSPKKCIRSFSPVHFYHDVGRNTSIRMVFVLLKHPCPRLAAFCLRIEQSTKERPDHFGLSDGSGPARKRTRRLPFQV